MNSKFLNLEIHLHYSLLTSIINKANIKKKKISIFLKAAHLSPTAPQRNFQILGEARPRGTELDV